MSAYFDRVEEELRSAAARQDAGRNRRIRRRPGRHAALAVVAAISLAVPAGAAVIAFRPNRESDGLIRTAPRTIIATGQDPEFGAWEAFVSSSSSGPCFGIRLIDPPGPSAGSTSEGCGTSDQPARIGGGDGPRRTALFGFVPAGATHVRIQAKGHLGREFPTYAVAGRSARFYFASLPANPRELPGLRVVPLR